MKSALLLALIPSAPPSPQNFGDLAGRGTPFLGSEVGDEAKGAQLARGPRSARWGDGGARLAECRWWVAAHWLTCLARPRCSRRRRLDGDEVGLEHPFDD